MTSTRAAALRRRRRFGEPDPDGSLPCVSCGRRVKHPDPAKTEHVRIWSQRTAIDDAQGYPTRYTDVPATRCDDCTHRRILAESLLVQYPAAARGHGNVGVDRLDAALAALDCAGLFNGFGLKLKQLTEDDMRVRDLIRFMAVLGAEASWVTQRIATPSARPWAHVSTELRKEINAAVRNLIRRPFEPILMFVPPGSLHGTSPPGCLFCGVQAVKARESTGELVWGRLVRVDPGVVGGKPRPEPVEGYLCPPCRSAFDSEGAIGMRAVERALMAFLGYHAIPGWNLTFNTVHAFAALRPGTEPSAKPWAHLDTKAIKVALDSSLGVRPNEPRAQA